MGLDHDFDIVFIGWMEPGTDFRDEISKTCSGYSYHARSGSKFHGREYEGHGFELIAR